MNRFKQGKASEFQVYEEELQETDLYNSFEVPFLSFKVLFGNRNSFK